MKDLFILRKKPFLVLLNISHDYFHGCNHRTIEEVTWLQFQKAYFDQHLQCASSKCRSKYTTFFCNLLITFFSFFQWTGDDNMRQILDGKLVLLNLLCQTKSDKSNSDRDIERPCISFRVAGSPGKKLSINFRTGHWDNEYNIVAL